MMTESAPSETPTGIISLCDLLYQDFPANFGYWSEASEIGSKWCEFLRNWCDDSRPFDAKISLLQGYCRDYDFLANFTETLSGMLPAWECPDPSESLSETRRERRQIFCYSMKVVSYVLGPLLLLREYCENAGIDRAFKMKILVQNSTSLEMLCNSISQALADHLTSRLGSPSSVYSESTLMEVQALQYLQKMEGAPDAERELLQTGALTEIKRVFAKIDTFESLGEMQGYTPSEGMVSPYSSGSFKHGGVLSSSRGSVASLSGLSSPGSSIPSIHLEEIPLSAQLIPTLNQIMFVHSGNPSKFKFSLFQGALVTAAQATNQDNFLVSLEAIRTFYSECFSFSVPFADMMSPINFDTDNTLLRQYLPALQSIWTVYIFCSQCEHREEADDLCKTIKNTTEISTLIMLLKYQKERYPRSFFSKKKTRMQEIITALADVRLSQQPNVLSALQEAVRMIKPDTPQPDPLAAIVGHRRKLSVNDDGEWSDSAPGEVVEGSPVAIDAGFSGVPVLGHRSPGSEEWPGVHTPAGSEMAVPPLSSSLPPGWQLGPAPAPRPLWQQVGMPENHPMYQLWNGLDDGEKRAVANWFTEKK